MGEPGDALQAGLIGAR